jgi:hypothetical protein
MVAFDLGMRQDKPAVLIVLPVNLRSRDTEMFGHRANRPVLVLVLGQDFIVMVGMGRKVGVVLTLGVGPM